MNHPELLRKIGKTKDRHALGLFQCKQPGCTNTFIARIDQVISEHTISCGCRKRKNFIMKIERQIKSKTTKPIRLRFLGERRSGANRAYLCKKYGVSHQEYPLLLALAEEEYKQPEVTMPKTDVPTASPSAPTVQHIYNAPVTIINEAPRPVQPSVPAQPHKIPTIDYMPPVPAVYNKPMPGTIAFDKLSFGERIKIQGELARLRKESN